MSRAADSAYNAIRDGINTGTLAPGVALREADLAVLTGVSRTPVRDALRRLEVELLVRRDAGGHAYVSDWNPDDFEDMFALRGLLEAHAATRAATRITAAEIAALRAVNAQLKAAIDAPDGPDIAGFVTANRAFHTGLIAAAASPQLAAILAQLVERPVVTRTVQHYDRAQLARSATDHDELIAAFTSADGGWAGAVMQSHIRRAYHAFAAGRAR